MQDNMNNTQNNQDAFEPSEEITVSAMETETKKQKNKFFKSRSFKYGSLATALTAAVIVVVIALNMVFSVLTDSYSWAIDLTSTGLYEISDATKQVVNSLEDNTEIEITVFYDEAGFPYYIAEPLKRFCNLSDNINYTYVDPEKNPSELTKYGSEYNIMAGAVVVKNGDRIRVFNVDDYFEVDQETGSMHIYIEERLAAGILFVTREEIPMVYFIKGHGEAGYEPLMNIFANNGANVEEINLLTDGKDFDPSSKLMVICNPTRDYSEDEIRAMDDFINNDNLFGRNIMYFSAADAVSLPNLEKYLENWGIAFNNDMVIDFKYNAYSSANCIISKCTTEEIMSTGATISTEVSPIFYNTRSMKRLFEENGIYKTQSLITSMDETSYSRDNMVITQEWEKQDGDKPGPFDLSVLSMKYKYLNNIQVQSYVLACGSVNVLDETFLKYYGTGEYLMQIYKIMVNEQDDTILDAQKSSSSTLVVLNTNQTQTMTAIVLVVIPLIFLIIGLVVYIRRRFL